MKYNFKEITVCEMCGDKTENHKILGQRLNKTQGYKPKSKTGISVGIVKCTNCNLIYSNPQPIPFDLQDHYGTPPEEYWKEDYFEWKPTYFKPQIEEASELISFKKGMKSLDIGAGLGKSMLSMQHKGFDVHGLEPSIPFYERAISKMGIDKEKLKLGSIEELDYEKNTFDFITFGAVFEHLYEPSKCLEKALGWLKPNGIIQIEVPSSKWLMPKFMNFYFKLIGTNYVTNLSPMHTPFHLHEFDLKSFTELSNKLNFSIEKHRYEVCSIYYMPKFLHGPLKSYMKATDKGMQLTVYLRKGDGL
ncbi:class I SAM-dependent methyltransferase [Brumimicrobium oceani]|uniref:Class I SAM-dependent methyltransferase n=1 Tax=Brumimicrobium oceani TaxID=2100725 RepID=A0A2U2XC31_9FLAO|nr:class I SAM-dependent methyltransferase [Brumimicrobium oceani]PWH85327.1 class I SAM-dependent methyltransferase [Brumimicrobium oceani]